MTKIPDWYSEVGPGWRPLLVLLHNQLDRIFPKFEVTQIKEKFGGLRVYYSLASGDDQTRRLVNQLVNAAEDASYECCESCGAEGVSRKPAGSTRGWIKTLCDTHQSLRHRPSEPGRCDA